MTHPASNHRPEQIQKKLLFEETIKAIQQVNSYPNLTLDQIRVAQCFFENSDQRNHYLSELNEQIQLKNKSQQSQSEHSEIQNFARPKKWDEKSQNMKQGKFSEEERNLLINSLSEYLANHDIDLEGFIKDIQLDSKPNLVKKKMWGKICSVLPNRTLRSSYRFIIRQICSSTHKQSWTNQEVQKLIQLQQEHGNKWTIIGKALKKSSENVRNKYRNLSKDRENSQYWKLSELVNLLNLISEMAQINFVGAGLEKQIELENQHNQRDIMVRNNKLYNSKRSIHPNNQLIIKYINPSEFVKLLSKQIKWKSIAQKIKTKSQLECKNKYFQLLNILESNGNIYDYREVFTFIEAQNPTWESTIDWEKWDNQDMSVDRAKAKWSILKRRIQHRNKCSWSQLLEQIEKYLDKQIFAMIGQQISKLQKEKEKQRKLERKALKKERIEKKNKKGRNTNKAKQSGDQRGKKRAKSHKSKRSRSHQSK